MFHSQQKKALGIKPPSSFHSTHPTSISVATLRCLLELLASMPSHCWMGFVEVNVVVSGVLLLGKRGKNSQSGYADYPGSCWPWGWLSPSILCGSPYRKSHPGVLAGWQLPRDPWRGPCGNSQRAAPRRRSSLYLR